MLPAVAEPARSAVMKLEIRRIENTRLTAPPHVIDDVPDS